VLIFFFIRCRIHLFAFPQDCERAFVLHDLFGENQSVHFLENIDFCRNDHERNCQARFGSIFFNYSLLDTLSADLPNTDAANMSLIFIVEKLMDVLLDQPPSLIIQEVDGICFVLFPFNTYST
jgi:hypothetical protein